MTLKPFLLLTSLSLSLTLAPAALSAFPTSDPINPYPAYIYPAQGMLTSSYGWRWGRLHKGIDIAAAVGTPILAERQDKTKANLVRGEIVRLLEQAR